MIGRWAVTFLPLALMTAGCQTIGIPRNSADPTQENSKPAAKDADDDGAGGGEDKGHAKAKLERELDIAKQKLIKSKMELDHEEKDVEVKLARAGADVRIARDELQHFEDVDSGVKLDTARLSLKRAQDGYNEAKEELAQLEMMYAEQDLADKTREIVINRGRRRLQRSLEEMNIEKRQLESLEKHELKQEKAKLALELEEKINAEKSAHRDSDSALLDKKIEVMSAESDIKRIEEEMSDLSKKKP